MNRLLLSLGCAALLGCALISPADLAAAQGSGGTESYPTRPASAPPSTPPNEIAPPTSGTPQPLGVPGSWTLRFDDEFNGRSLDLAKWQPNWLGPTARAITPPVTEFDLNCMAPAQVTEMGGHLVLAAASRACEVAGGHRYRYASGLINTRSSFRFTYGFLEARIYVPPAPGGGPADFPAFWATGVGPWPRSGELDVMEVLRGCGPGIGFHFHSATGSSGGCAPAADAVGWHVYGALWEKGAVSFYYDGELVGRLTRGITAAPMYLVLDNSVDPHYGAHSEPTEMLVDYVRVWQ